VMCLGAATGGRGQKAKATGKGKAAAAAKEKEKEKQVELIAAQFNTAMPHSILRVVSDADAAVSY